MKTIGFSLGLRAVGMAMLVQQVVATITIGEVILRMETVLPDDGNPAGVAARIQDFVNQCILSNVQGVSIELKRGDVDSQLGHLYFTSQHPNTAAYTERGYNEGYLFDLLSELRSANIETYAWWPTFNDAILAQSDPSNLAQHSRDFGSNTLSPSNQFVSPHSDVVRQHQLDLIQEILTHPIMMGWDGIRLDYVRFQGDFDDFSPSARQGYVDLYGSDLLSSVTSHLDTQWIEYRRDTITTFLHQVTTLAHDIDASLDVGGYLLPFPAHPQGFYTFPGQGNDYTMYHPFGLRVLPMIYWQDWGGGISNYNEWTREKMFYSVQYTADSPQVWPTFSITTSCGHDEPCNRQVLLDALLIAANSGKQNEVQYEDRTVSMFYYFQWTLVEWDRLRYAVSQANDIITTGTVGPAPTPPPNNNCPHAVPIGYQFFPFMDSPGNDHYLSTEYRNIPLIANDCDADDACHGFNSNGWTKSAILDESDWEEWTQDECLGLYIKDEHLNPQTTLAPTPQPSESPTPPPTSQPTPSPTPEPSESPTPPPTLQPTPSPTDPQPTESPTPPPTSQPTPLPTPDPTTLPTAAPLPTPSPSATCPYPVPAGYQFYPLADSPGYDYYQSERRNIPAITADCDADPICMGFNSNGWTKHFIGGNSQWQQWTNNACLGLYVKEPPQDCPVPSGYKFYPLRDSPGHDAGASQWRNIAAIAADCNASGTCKGFNSNGWRKSLIRDANQWYTWTSDPCLGLYVKEQS